MSDPTNPPTTRPFQFQCSRPDNPGPCRAKDVNGVIRNIRPGDLVYQDEIVNLLLMQSFDINYLCGKRNGEWAPGWGQIEVPPSGPDGYFVLFPAKANEIGNDANNYSPDVRRPAVPQSW